MDLPSSLQQFDTEIQTRIAEYLERTYADIFDAAAIDSHLDENVGFEFVRQVVPSVLRAVGPGATVLDIGAGFGSFVILARLAGLDASGIELSSFEVAIARERIAVACPDADSISTFVQADARDFRAPPEKYDAITMWNVLEHIDDIDGVLQQCVPALKPGGRIFIICPNYAAFRREAHYQVPWAPLMPRRLGSWYLKAIGRNPDFFDSSIFYRTNWDVMRTLRRHGLQIYDGTGMWPMSLTKMRFATQARYFFTLLRFYNPLKGSVVLVGRLPERSSQGSNL